MDDKARLLEEGAAHRSYTEASPQLADVLDLREDLLRGVPLPALMAGGASLFRNRGEAARTDPRGTFDKSQQVESVTYFLSHSWSAGRWSKYVALLYTFNLRTALWCCSVVAYLSCLANLMIGDDLPKWMGLIQPEFPSPVDGQISQFYQSTELFVPLALLLALFTAHQWRRVSDGSSPTVFLDIW